MRRERYAASVALGILPSAGRKAAVVEAAEAEVAWVDRLEVGLSSSSMNTKITSDPEVYLLPPLSLYP